MRNKLHSIALALLVCVLLNTAALAGVKSKNITFSEEITVGDTVVKSGSYKVAYDDQAKEVQILSGGKIIARATANLEEAKTTGRYAPAYRTVRVDSNTKLLSTISLGGMDAVLNGERVATARSASTGGK